MAPVESFLADVFQKVKSVIKLRKIALKEVSFTDMVWRMARTKLTLLSMEMEVIGKTAISTDDYGTTAEDRIFKFKNFVADYSFNMLANCLEENMMDFLFMTSTMIKQKGVNSLFIQFKSEINIAVSFLTFGRSSKYAI